MPTLRRLTIEDYDDVVALWRRVELTSLRPDGRDSRKAFTRQLEGGQTVLGLEKDGALIGVVVVTDDTRRGWINRLSVDPAHRRRGHGITLLRAAEEELRRRGIRIIALLIEDWNGASIALARKSGFRMHDDIVYLSKRDWPGA